MNIINTPTFKRRSGIAQPLLFGFLLATSHSALADGEVARTPAPLVSSSSLPIVFDTQVMIALDLALAAYEKDMTTPGVNPAGQDKYDGVGMVVHADPSSSHILRVVFGSLANIAQRTGRGGGIEYVIDVASKTLIARNYKM